MPWQLSYAASADLENSELQTDVMRFMAILAFCLVAIFAIVQSMPLTPQQKPEPVAATEPDDIPALAQPVPLRTAAPSQPKPAPAKPVALSPTSVVLPAARPEMKPDVKPARPEPVTRVVSLPAPEPILPRPVYVPAPRPAPVTVARTPEPLPQPANPMPTETATPARQGLSLRFESDSVLRSLVERRLVGLYAIDGNNFYQMAVTADLIRFGPGTAPAQYHEMVYETVPLEVARTFESQQAASAREVVWGVTLPAGTTQQLRRFVQTNFAGSLIITSDAQLALAGSG